MFWSYFIGFTALAVGIYFFLALIGSDLLVQLVLLFVGIAALAGLATALERLKEQAGALARLEEKLDRLLKEPESGKLEDRERSSEDEL